MVGFQPLPFEPTTTVKFFSAGFAACIADLVTFPLDTAKVRLQIQGESSVSSVAGTIQNAAKSSGFKYRGIFGTIRTMSAEEGVRSLYNGIIPGLQRQMCFASIRIGLYDTVKQFYQTSLTGKTDVPEHLGIRILAGITSGGFAVLCAQPTDVVKVRMQAQKRGVSARYTGTMHAYRTIAVHEGMRGLWKGTLPNVTRNAIVNASELVSYDLLKEQILKYNILSDNLPCHFLSAFGAGFITTCIASPVDVVKTRFMNSPPGKYTGAIDCALTMFREGGPKAFYKGFMPSFMRLGSWNITMFVFYEQLKRAFMQHRLDMEIEV